MYADLLPAEAEAWHLKCLGGQKMPSLEPLHPVRGGDRVTLTLKPTPRKFYKPPDLDKHASSSPSMANTSTTKRDARRSFLEQLRLHKIRPRTDEDRAWSPPHPSGTTTRPAVKPRPVQPPPPHRRHQEDSEPNRSSGQELPKSAQRSKNLDTSFAWRRVTPVAHSRPYLAAV